MMYSPDHRSFLSRAFNSLANEDRQRTYGVNTNKTTPRIAGVLYIIGTVAGMLSLAFTESIRSTQDCLGNVSTSQNQMVMGALCVLIMGLALAMVPVMMFPILKRYNETLALGYVVFRGGLEAVTHMAIAGLYRS